jgi:hypothetical protein
VIQQRNPLENNLNDRIKQITKQCRERFLNYTIDIENELNDIAKEIKQIRQNNEFNQKLNRLKQQLHQPFINIKVITFKSLSINIFFIFLLISNSFFFGFNKFIFIYRQHGNKLESL